LGRTKFDGERLAGERNVSTDGVMVGPPALGRATSLLEQTLEPLADELHRTATMRKMLDGTVPKQVYTSLIQSLLTLHRSLERAIAAASHLAAFSTRPFQRDEPLLRDMRILHTYVPVRSNAPLDEFESFAQSWIRPPSAALIGAYYAIESERRHSLRIARPLAQALGLKVAPRHGLDYHLEGSERTVRRYEDLQKFVDERVVHDARIADLAEGARRTMRTLIALHSPAAPPA
jgi:hypothetical protein